MENPPGPIFGWRSDLAVSDPFSQSQLVPERLLLFKRPFGAVHSRDWLMLTSDSGQSWRGYEIPDDWFPGSLDGSDFFFADEEHGWFLNSRTNGLWRTSDGGVTWDCVDREFRGEVVSFSDPLRGYALTSHYPSGWGARPMLFATLDGGTTWREGGRILTSLSLARPQLTVTPDGALLVKNGLQGPMEVLMGSTDGGKNWKELHRTKWANFNFSFVSANHGWIVERNKLFFTVLASRNGGVDWEVISEIRH